MATQTGLQLSGPDKPYEVVSTIPRPVPGPKQILVKSLVTGINPVEPMMHHTGAGILSPYPTVLGCEASGVVVDVGPEVTRFAVGDYVFGCTRVGTREYATFQETFLMDEGLAWRRPAGMSAEEASTLGVALDTAAIAVFAGLAVELPEPGTQAPEKDEWIIVLGGSGSVGAAAVQLARLAGYKVLASSSPSKASVTTTYGAAATLDHNLNLADQLTAIKAITGGNFARVFDASTRAHETAAAALEQVSVAKEKWYSTANPWSPLATPAGVGEYRCKLGENGLDTPEGKVITPQLEAWIPKLEVHLANGALRPLEYQVVEGDGWEAVVKASETFEGGGAKKKLAVRVQSE